MCHWPLASVFRVVSLMFVDVYFFFSPPYLYMDWFGSFDARKGLHVRRVWKRTFAWPSSIMLRQPCVSDRTFKFSYYLTCRSSLLWVICHPRLMSIPCPRFVSLRCPAPGLEQSTYGSPGSPNEPVTRQVGQSAGAAAPPASFLAFIPGLVSVEIVSNFHSFTSLSDAYSCFFFLLPFLPINRFTPANLTEHGSVCFSTWRRRFLFLGEGLDVGWTGEWRSECQIMHTAVIIEQMCHKTLFRLFSLGVQF